MFSLRHVLIHVIFCVAFVTVISEWIPYNGLWYYISEDNETMTYAESEDRCKLLQGRLAVLSGWPDDKNKLASFTGSTRRWIYGLPAKVIYELDQQESDDSGNKFLLEYIVNADNKYGYICDWQCHSLRVYPLALPNYRSEDEYYNQRNMKDYLSISGVYDLKKGSELRQFYNKLTQVDSPRRKIYQKWVKFEDNDNNHVWCFMDNNEEDNSEDIACTSSSPSSYFTPYTGTYPWETVETSNPILLHFYCRDCNEYEVSLQVGSITETGTFYASLNGSERMITKSDDESYLEYDQIMNLWRLKWNSRFYLLQYLITPTVDHMMEFYSQNTKIILLCKTYPYPAQQSTVPSMEEGTTMELGTQETTTGIQSAVSNIHMSTETIAFSGTSSDANSETADTVTVAHEKTTIEPKSENISSDNKTTIYIAVGCIVGGVVTITIITLGFVYGRRRKINKRKRDTEHRIQNHIPKSKANLYSVDTQRTNYAEIKDSSIVVENTTGKANSDPLYEQAKDPTPENVYSEAETVDLNNKHMYINGGFGSESNKSQNKAGSPTLDKKTGNKTADDGNDSETEFFNNDIYEGNVNMDRKNAEVPQPVPVKSPSGSNIEMYNNSLYDVSAKSIGQNRSELVKNMNNVDEDIEMYDNDLYGS